MKLDYQKSLIGAVILSVGLRARFVFAPLYADEGGILSVARDWADGNTLYRNVWIDRPQGLIALFRGWDALPGTGPSSARILAIGLGAAAILAAASVATSLFNRRVGALTAWFTAALTASPLLEGFAANGELLSAGFALPGLALVAATIAGRIRIEWLLAAGALFGLALSVKQSAFDILFATMMWLVLAWLLGWQPRRRIAAGACLVVAGLGVVVGMLAWHGTTLGWTEYWYVVAGFRLEARSALSNPELDKLALSLLFVSPVVVPVAALVVRAHSRFSMRSMFRRPHAMLIACWCIAALASFAVGGSYFRHYFVILAFPLAVVAALAAVNLGGRGMRSAALALAVSFVAALPFIANPRLILGDVPESNVAVADWIRNQERLRGPLVVYAYCADAALYTMIDQAPPYRFLWEDHVRLAKGAQEGLFQMLTGPRSPDYLIRLQPLEQCDESGLLAAEVRQNYVTEVTFGRVEVMRHSILPPAAD